MYLRLLRHNRDFRLLYAGTLISLGGDWFLTVALLDLVLSLTGSATLASLMLLCQSLPIFIVTPFAGHLVDRVDRRKLMIVVDVVRTGACLLPLLARTPAMLPFAYAGVIVIAVGSSYFEPASQAALPNLVSAEELAPANVLMGSTWGTMLAVGAAIGGAVTMRFGRDVSFVVDAVSFLASAVILMMIRTAFSESLAVGRSPLAEGEAALRPTADSQQPTLSESVRETLRYARAHPRVLALLTSKGGYGVGAGVVAMLSVFGKEVFRAGAFGIGLLFAARGLGALFGPFMIRSVSGRDERQYSLISVAVLVFGAGYIGLGISRSLLLGAIAVFVAHLGGGAQWLTSTYGLQREVPDWIRGRVFAADYGFVTLTMAVSSLVAGVLSDRFSPMTATVSIASLSVCWALFWGAWTWKLWR
jgi:MFS family permease